MLFDIDHIFHGFSPTLIEWSAPQANPFLDSSYGLRTVKYYELEYIIDGDGFVLTDGVPYPIIANSINFRHPGMVVEGVGIYHCLLLRFSCDIKHPIIPELTQLLSSYRLPIHSIIASKFQTLFQDLSSCATGQDLSFKIVVLELFQYMIHETESSMDAYILNRSLNYSKSQNSILYIQDHFSENITVTQLAELSGYSPYYFTRLFKCETGYTPIDFLIKYRMNRVKHLLLTTTLPVESIAPLCGFYNYSYFFRTFKRFYHISPSQYRKYQKKIK